MSATFKVIFIGAGDINFGTIEGPWNHSARLEALLGPKLQVLSVIDPDAGRSRQRLDEKRLSRDKHIRESWRHTLLHINLIEAALVFGEEKVDLIVIGCPPQFRGTPMAGHDTDIAVLRAFPRVRGIFIEKPVASVEPDVSLGVTMQPCHAVAHALESWIKKEPGRVVSVGYMFRYLSGVRKIREILEEHALVPRMINARYFMAYESTKKTSWWSKAASGGPIVEQATHLVDLIRFIATGTDEEANPVILSSLQATTVEHTDEAGQLAAIPIDEEQIEPHDRIPRATAAFWRHKRGTLVTLCHSVALHDQDYHAELEVIADGWLIQLFAIYTGKPRLVVRSPRSEFDKELLCTDDPFESEMAAMVQAIKTGSSARIMSSFRDALRTYELTWAIRKAGEQSLSARKQAQRRESRVRSGSTISETSSKM